MPMPRMLPSKPEAAQKRFLNRRRILLVDPDPPARGSMADVLLSVRSAYDVTAIATVADLAGSAPLSKPIDLAILNAGPARVSDGHVRAEIGRLRSRFAAIPLVLFTDLVSIADIQRALRLGVRAYFPARLGGEAALAVLRIVLAGGIFVPTEPESASPGISPDGNAAGQRPSVVKARGKRVGSATQPGHCHAYADGMPEDARAELARGPAGAPERNRNEGTVVYPNR
jgi:DNA-binding NarL/FixJ family response regulator